jgi:ribonuclease M5
MNKIKIKQVVIVEGKCDKAVLENVVEATIIPVNGFGVYKDKKKRALIQKYARNNGVIILTDSDNAGRQIRNYLKNILDSKTCEIHDLYVENLYEVEDTKADFLREIFRKFENRETETTVLITRERLFDDGFTGGANASQKRKQLLKFMNLPENLSTTALLDVLNKFGLQEYEEFLK